MNCIDLMSKLSKMLRYVAKHSKQRKTTKEIKLQWISSIWHQNDLKCWVTSQNYKCDHITMNLHRFDVKTITTQNYESDQIIMNCIDLTSKRSKKLSYVPKLQKWSHYNDCIDLMSKLSKMLRYVAKHSKQRKTTKEIKLQWISSIWHQNDLKCWVTSQNYKCDHITMNLHRFDVKTITTQNYESDQIIMNCIDLTSKRSKMLRYVAKHSKQRKTTKLIKLQWIASIWCQNNQKTQNYKSNQITINLYRFDAKTIKNVELYVAKHSEQRKTTKMIKL